MESPFPTMVMLILYRIKPDAGTKHYKFPREDGLEKIEKIRCMEAQEPQEFEQDQKI